MLTSVAAEALGKNMQREDQLIFALLHTFWEVRPCILTLACSHIKDMHCAQVFLSLISFGKEPRQYALECRCSQCCLAERF